MDGDLVKPITDAETLALARWLRATLYRHIGVRGAGPLEESPRRPAWEAFAREVAFAFEHLPRVDPFP